MRLFFLLLLSIALHVSLWASYKYFASKSKTQAKKEITPAPLRIKIVTAPQQAVATPPPKEKKSYADKSHTTKQEKIPKHFVKTNNTTSTKARKTRESSTHHQRGKMSIGKEAIQGVSYAQFLQQSQQELANIDMRGDSEIIDINTNEYRYIGYFTAMRNAISLVWQYPLRAVEARQQGVVKLSFAVNTDGEASMIKITQSSGYHLLDTAIIAAIRNASPFSPLPNTLGEKKKILISGTFWYVLNGS